MDERYEKYVKIAERAEKEGLCTEERINLLMDIESADKNIECLIFKFIP